MVVVIHVRRRSAESAQIVQYTWAWYETMDNIHLDFIADIVIYIQFTARELIQKQLSARATFAWHYCCSGALCNRQIASHAYAEVATPKLCLLN